MAENTQACAPYPVVVFIGRFQPFHNSHKQIVEQALRTGRHVAILVGSAFRARNLRNPFLTEEVIRMIRNSFTEEENLRLSLRGVPDTYNDTAWIESVQRNVMDVIREQNISADRESDICLIGHHKDHSSFYLGLFPRWSMKNIENIRGMSATPLREEWMSEIGYDYRSAVPKGTLNVMDEVRRSPSWEWLYKEYNEATARKENQGGRLPLIYTCDGVVTQAGYVMLVERSAHPGKGLLSLPGGHLRENETSRQTLVGNLVESHGLMTGPRVSRADAINLVDHYVGADETFDHPHRSDRGRAISRAYLVDLPPMSEGLHKLRKGAAEWYPLVRLDDYRERMFEDHYHIIRRMTARASWKN